MGKVVWVDDDPTIRTLVERVQPDVVFTGVSIPMFIAKPFSTTELRAHVDRLVSA